MNRQTRRRGRPRQDRPVTVPASDASLSTLAQYRARIAHVVERWFSDCPCATKQALFCLLADEAAAYGAMAVAVSISQPGKRGPKPKIEHGVFVATVRDILKAHRIKLVAWRNGRNVRDELQRFCQELLQVTGVSSTHISDRTVRTLPVRGFHKGIG